MLGMDQVQRSNAVGANTSYLPSGDIGREGGGTYTGQATEPTIQDYENFFGPSARDIKTDLQRFKRHGRWHLPDVLQGPNPWLTDRIDGLITDATNSPFTTKILPYRYKEDVDGKIKWNVWSFDEGMASRVPYESAARTLTQSKRSFAGYMVRQGMAIVLEHNFMMTPKGRENFKNQLNQLIGSIQYTNDLDVHMALILAPSYQKTMREQYYTSDKSPAQLCREYADLFGMMQKNVNALDILIEEGKAILRTWGGPMPDFLLCNSKLTFQMTMTPEKTNYITQGIDGVKRLRQGPDLGSYRGLSVVHTRSFAMEAGQHPRDVLRRRVRTAEYYRILPDERNRDREFEFFDEGRDNWFTLSFKDLLRCARCVGGQSTDHVEAVYNSLSKPVAQSGHRSSSFAILGANYSESDAGDIESLQAVLNRVQEAVNESNTPLKYKYETEACSVYRNSRATWVVRGPCMGVPVRYTEPNDNEVWDNFKKIRGSLPENKNALGLVTLTTDMMSRIYSKYSSVTLKSPFVKDEKCQPNSGAWYTSYLFYLECIKRTGYSLNMLQYTAANVEGLDFDDAVAYFEGLKKMDGASNDIAAQYLGSHGAVSCVNHPGFLNFYFDVQSVAQSRNALFSSTADYYNRKILITDDILKVLLSEYTSSGGARLRGVDWLNMNISGGRDALNAKIEDFKMTLQFSDRKTDILDFNVAVHDICVKFFKDVLQSANLTLAKQCSNQDLAKKGFSSIPLFLTTLSHVCRAESSDLETAKECLKIANAHYGQLSLEMIKFLAEKKNQFNNNPLFKNFNSNLPDDGSLSWTEDFDISAFVEHFRHRLVRDPFDAETSFGAINNAVAPSMFVSGAIIEEVRLYARYHTNQEQNSGLSVMGSISPDSDVEVVIDLNNFFLETRSDDSSSNRGTLPEQPDVGNVELVIFRPNIEHNMLGVIMGLGGNDLGNTLWGQTELSVYDDSMHGIWGMSYKYHERAIVFNEKNLIRMWDIAYDGYNGGKDDTYVDWTDENAPNGYGVFKEATMNLGKNYRGPSMMVLAFVHADRASDTYNRHFRRNWPSPVVFYDTHHHKRGHEAGRETLAIDYDNVQTVDVEDFRVFNNELYASKYAVYRELMPDFRSLHVTRKNPGQSSADNETGTDCLAFQGSMRIKERGVVVQDIQGSGHHGPDYVGVASVRAGKGQKVAGQQPTLHRLI